MVELLSRPSIQKIRIRTGEPNGTIELQQVLEVLSDVLDSTDQEVIILRFGLFDGKTRTLEEVGRELGVTRERIHKREGRALHRLQQHPLILHYLLKLVLNYLGIAQRRVPDRMTLKRIFLECPTVKKQSNSIRMRTWRKINRAGITSTSRLQKLSQKEAMIQLHSVTRGRVTKQCLKELWWLVNSRN